ncbi:MAG: two-component regulator propeller domain-containing protein [Allomuricauda sp.]
MKFVSIHAHSLLSPKGLLSTLFLVLWPLMGFMQENRLRFEEFTIQDGLASVNCILKDKDGFLWFGGTHGLYRFDGYDFKAFFASDGDDSSLSNNNVISLFQDDQGLIWVGTMRGGINYYDPSDDSFVNYRNTPDKSIFTNNYITSIAQDRDGLIWIGTFGDGIYVYDKVGETFSRIRKMSGQNGSISNNDVFSILTDNEKIWITTNEGILDCYNKDTGEFSQFRYSDQTYKSTRTGQRLMMDHKGDIWISTEEQGVFRYNKETSLFKHYSHSKHKPSISTDNITDIKEGKPGEIWVTTGAGLNLLDTNTETFHVYQRDLFDRYSITNNISYCLYVEDDETLWMGMGNGTVNKTINSPFKIYQTSFSPNERGLSFDVVGSLYAGEDELWVGTGGGGLDKFDLQSRKFRNYSHDPNDPKSIPSNIVMSVLKDKDDNVWTGNSLENILACKKNGVDYFYQPSIKGNNTHVSVFDIAEDDDNNIWIATYNSGLYSFNRITEKLKNYQTKNSRLFSDKLLRLLFDGSGRLWIGSLERGVQIFDMQRNRFTPFSEMILSEETFSMDHPVKDIFEDGQGIIWIATEGQGLFRYDPKSKLINSLTTDDGLPSNSIYGVIQDNQGTLWFSTNQGIVSFNPKAQTVMVFNTSNGLPTNDFESGAAAISIDGELFFGSKKGLIAFYPEKLSSKFDSINLQLTSFRIFNNEVKANEMIDGHVPLDSSVRFERNIELPYFLNNFTFEFAAPGHSSPHNIKYEYQLEGLDNRWINTTSQRNFATYSNLSPGKYKFRLRAHDESFSGNSDYSEKTLDIRIIPVWWQTKWAFLTYSLFLGGLAYYIYSILKNRVRLKNQLLMEKYSHQKDRELHQSKIGFFTTISHELRTSLTLIMAPLSELVSSNFENNRTEHLIRTMNHNGQRLLDLVNQILDFRKMEFRKGKLKVSKVYAKAFFDEICLPFVQLAKEKGLNFAVSNIDHDEPSWMDTDKVEIIIYNLLSNAFKFARQNVWLTVGLQKNNGEIVIEVGDDGDGIPENDLTKIFEKFYQAKDHKTNIGTGLGLAITKNLVELHQGRITVQSIPGEKTIFKVILPIIKEFYSKNDLINNESVDVVTSSESILPPRPNAKDEKELPLLLIVEDNQEIRTLLEDSFRESYNVYSSINGSEGIEVARDIIPDIVISDITMPIMNGLELCEKLKTDQRTSHIPIILLTARSSHTFKLEGYQHGADEYITKPFDLGLLKIRIKNLIESRQALREKFKKEIILKPKDIAINNADEMFLEKIMDIIEKNMANTKYSISMLAKDIGMSHSVLYRKIIALTNQNINDFVKSMRLKRAAELIQKSDFTINEISDRTGFSNPKYFSTCFKNEYGKTPSQYRLFSSE